LALFLSETKPADLSRESRVLWLVGLALPLSPFFTSTIDYWVAPEKLMDHSDERGRKRLLLLSIVSNLVVLGFFKITISSSVHFQASFKTLGLGLDLPLLQVVLPLGISFYTFQALSYTIDVYRRDIAARE
jgi:D-alanyl-lipoteichoic acid acyltransferase DltB (MBOAT superfamily)